LFQTGDRQSGLADAALLARPAASAAHGLIIGQPALLRYSFL
jgi:hypothetical protein